MTVEPPNHAIEKVRCSRCRCSRLHTDFLTATGEIRKTCLKCRESGKHRKRDKTKQREYARAWRKKNPCYDKRDRKEYHRQYKLRKKEQQRLLKEAS